MKKWFDSQSKLVKVLLLVIPFVNWICEMILRWEKAINSKDVVDILVAVLATVGLGNILGWIDAVCIVLSDKLFLE